MRKILLIILAFVYSTLMQAQLSMEEIHEKMNRQEYDVRWTKKLAKDFDEYKKSTSFPRPKDPFLTTTTCREFRQYTPEHLFYDSIEVIVEPLIFALYNYDKQKMSTTTIGLIVTAKNSKGEKVKRHYYNGRKPEDDKDNNKQLNTKFKKQKVSFCGKQLLWDETKTLLPDLTKKRMFLCLSFEIEFDLFKYNDKIKNISLIVEDDDRAGLSLVGVRMETEKFKGFVQGGKGLIKLEDR